MTTPDLAGLFAPPPPGPAQNVKYRQGTIVAWDPLTALNTVNIGGSLFADLPILNTNEALQLGVGDVVAVLAISPDGIGGAVSYAILGRLTIPGTTAAATAMNALGDAIGVATEPNQQSTTSASYTDLASVGPEVTVLVRASGRCLLVFGSYMLVTGIVFAHMAIAGAGPGGATFAASGAGAALGAGTNMAGLHMEGVSTSAVMKTGLTPGTWIFTAKYLAGGGFGNPATFSDRFLIAIPL